MDDVYVDPLSLNVDIKPLFLLPLFIYPHINDKIGSEKVPQIEFE